MNKTPKDLADEYADDIWAKNAFLAGYKAAQPKWISVKDRLPKPNEKVVCKGFYWMVLPALPKEEE
jgi:hypothetical protein